ncbi:TonB-dependent receptor [Microbulbifer sp. CAU 1566]|uniref:TonB-dependent receptor n=1 Tax=Microbulbifer sp. CAU 1566 TaxID=2933269 RepID=UPI00200307CA|nr:TonB-dependent receptor [Microbulbifer sp. CAU 1566]MCK7597670.1 TonB-dependent receptor [Microbulbifer sp. CAU 1566]
MNKHEVTAEEIPVAAGGNTVRNQGMQKTSMLGTLLSAAIAATGLTIPVVGNAQASETVLEEVMVTSRKRPENLQDISDSVTVFNAQQIQDARITTIKDFSALTPNLTVASNFRSGLNFVTIRGLITPQVGEAPLAFVVDGVTVPSIEFINQGLQQIERIEVLRGPQGALYGKNAIGGAVNIVTRQPSDVFEGSVQTSYGQGGDERISAAISGPLSDRVRYRLSGNYRSFDGLIENDFLNEEVDYVDGEYGVQGLISIDVSDRTNLELQGRYSDVTQGSNYMAFITKDQLEDFSIKNDGNALGRDESTLWNLTTKLEHETEYGDLTVIAGYNDADVLFFSDGDFTHLPESEENFYFPITQNNPIREDSTNLEVRFASDAHDTLEWLVGGFYERRDRRVEFDQIWDMTPEERVTYADLNGIDPSLVFVGERTVQDSESFALFGNLGYALSDTLTLTSALRYDEERREAYDKRAPQESAADDTYSELQPKLSLAWDAYDNVLLSATYSRGFRSGGFNEYAPTVQRDYAEEISDTFELGAKTSWLGGRLLLNSALFYIEQENAQFTRLNPSTFTLENLNVPEVQIRGFEAEMTARASDNLSLSLGVGVIDNEITKNAGFDAYTGLDLAGTVGDSMPYVSDYNLNGSIDYTRPLSGLFTMTSRLAFNTLGPRSFDLFEEVSGRSDTHTFVNGSIGLETEDWGVSFYGNNLFDEASPETVFLFNPLIRLRNQPRQFGIQGTVNF